MEFYVRFKAIRLLWFYLFYVLESVSLPFEPYVRFHSFISVRVTEWPSTGK